MAQAGVAVLAHATSSETEGQGAAELAAVSGKDFISNPLLHQEVVGPFSLLIRCNDKAELQEVVRHLEGQLTATLMATEADIEEHKELVELVINICGRLILNGVPTGVEVCLSMQHGGPFPSTTDARFGSVGADAIKRFVRPLAYQNWPDSLLPEALKEINPLGIWRTVNNELKK